MSVILFLCTGNSCRSQMAEGFARQILRSSEIYSAGTNPGRQNPFAIRVMNEIGVNISQQYPKGLDAVKDIHPDIIVTLCGGANEQCPIYFSKARHIHWPIDDPYDATGTEAEVMAVYRRVRDEIKGRIESEL